MAYITKDEKLKNLLETAYAAISYVGFANYAHRERAAKAAVSESALTGKYVDPADLDR